MCILNFIEQESAFFFYDIQTFVFIIAWKIVVTFQRNNFPRLQFGCGLREFRLLLLTKKFCYSHTQVEHRLVILKT